MFGIDMLFMYDSKCTGYRYLLFCGCHRSVKPNPRFRYDRKRRRSRCTKVYGVVWRIRFARDHRLAVYRNTQTVEPFCQQEIDCKTYSTKAGPCAWLFIYQAAVFHCIIYCLCLYGRNNPGRNAVQFASGNRSLVLLRLRKQ